MASHSRWKSFVVVEMNSNLLETTPSCMVVLCSQAGGIIIILLEGFVVINQFVKTVKLFHLKLFAIYDSICDIFEIYILYLSI